MCKLTCSPTNYASVWLLDNLWLISRQLNAYRRSLAFSAFAQTDIPQYQTDTTKIISAYLNLWFSHLFFHCHVMFPGVSWAVSLNISLFCVWLHWEIHELFKMLSFSSRYIAAVSKALFLPFLQLLKMGAMRLRTWTTDPLSKEGASKDIQFSELSCSLLAVLDSALNIWPCTNTVGSYTSLGVTYFLWIVEYAHAV